MLRVLASPSMIQSARRLGYKTYDGYDDLMADLHAGDMVLRWGNSYGRGETTEFQSVINKGDAIALNSAKREALLAMSDVVRTPRLYNRRIPAGVRAVIRNARHSNGSEFTTVVGPCDVPPETHATEYIDTPHEYRVWFAWDEMMAAYRTPMFGQSTSELCRSKWGYEFTGCGRYISSIAQKARDAIGLETGAADILCIDGDKEYCVLELNSAPSLDHPKVLKFYADAIREYTGMAPDPLDVEIQGHYAEIERLERTRV